MKIRRRSSRAVLAVTAAASLSLSFPPGASPVRAGDVPAAVPAAKDPLAARLSHLTIDDAIDIALHRNPDILRQLQEIQRLQGVFVEVRAAALPALVVNGTFSSQDRNLLQGGIGNSATGGTNLLGLGTGVGTGTGTTDPNAAAGALKPIPGTNPVIDPSRGINLVTVDPNGTPNNTIPYSSLFGSSGSSINNRSYNIQVSVQQTIYNAGVPPAIRQARFLRDAAYYQLRETVDTTVNTVKSQFYTVLVNQALIDINNENLRLLQSQLTDQQNRFAAGTVPRFDVLQASVAVSNQRPQVITATNNYALAFIGLARTLGIEYGPIQEKISPIKLVGNLNYSPQNFDPGKGVAAGKRNRALLKQQQLNILSQVEQIRVAAAGYQPTLVAQGGFQSRSNQISDDLGQTLNGWFYGATFNWNVFDGLATYGRVKQAKAALRAARITYLDSVNLVVQDIQSNFLTLKQSQELIASQVLNVSQAEEAVRLAQARLSAGAGTQLDVLQSQTGLLQAQTTELQARYNYALALGNYERVTGTSTVYNEAFDDPLTTAKYPLGADSTGAPAQGDSLPRGIVRTPGVKIRGTGQTSEPRINAARPDNKAVDRMGTDRARDDERTAPRKPLGERKYLLED